MGKRNGKVNPEENKTVNGKKVYNMDGEDVFFEVGSYYHDPCVMALQAYDAHDGEPYCVLTVNLGSDAGDGHILRPGVTFIDTNNCPFAEDFLEQIGAEPYLDDNNNVITKGSGFCEYPAYRFSKDILREMDEDGYDRYVEEYRTQYNAFRKFVEGSDFDPKKSIPGLDDEVKNDGKNDESSFSF